MLIATAQIPRWRLKFSGFVRPKVQNPIPFTMIYNKEKKEQILLFQRLKLENEEHSLNYFPISAMGLLSEKQQWLRCKIKAASWLSFRLEFFWWEKSKMPRKPKKMTFFSSSSFLITKTWRQKKSYQELVARSDTGVQPRQFSLSLPDVEELLVAQVHNNQMHEYGTCTFTAMNLYGSMCLEYVTFLPEPWWHLSGKGVVSYLHGPVIHTHLVAGELCRLP